MRQSSLISGFSLVEVLIAVSLVTIIAAGMASMFSSSQKQQNQMNLKFEADQLRKNLTVLLNSSSSWTNTINAVKNNTASGPKLDCLVNHTPCTIDGTDLSAGGKALVNIPINEVRDASDTGGKVVYDFSSAAAGFTQQGVACTSFISPPAVGNDQCPLHLNVTWTAVCGTSCIDPSVHLYVTPIYNSATKGSAFNPANYSADFLQGSGSSSNSTDPSTITWF